jgi:hypothetical protein
MKKKDPNVYPPGLTAKKVRQILEYYENQTDEEAAKEIATAPSASETTWIPVPAKLVPKIRKLIAKEG